MVSGWISSLVEHVAQQRMPPRSGALWSSLGTPLIRNETNGDVEHFRGDLDEGPFASAELRVNRRSGFALLVLRPRAGAKVRERDLALAGYGPFRAEISPDVAPEGTTTFVFQVHDVEVRFQLTNESRVLRALGFTWHAPPAVRTAPY
jgi:hypothetical protein